MERISEGFDQSRAGQEARVSRDFLIHSFAFMQVCEDGFIIMDSDSMILHLNKAAKMLIGDKEGACLSASIPKWADHPHGKEMKFDHEGKIVPDGVVAGIDAAENETWFYVYNRTGYELEYRGATKYYMAGWVRAYRPELDGPLPDSAKA